MKTGDFWKASIGSVLMAAASVGAVMLIVTTCSGCGQTFMAFPKEVGEGTRAFMASVTDQTLWDHVQGSTDGHVNNPGLETYAGVLYIAGAYLRGVDGDLRVAAAGHGTQVQREEAMRVIRDILGGDAENTRRIVDALFGLPETAPEPAAGSGDGG